MWNKSYFRGGWFPFLFPKEEENILDFLEDHYTSIQKLKKQTIDLLNIDRGLSSSRGFIHWNNAERAEYVELEVNKEDDKLQVKFTASKQGVFRTLVYLDNVQLT